MLSLNRTLRLWAPLAAVFLMASPGVASASTTVALWHMDDLGADGQTMQDSSGTTPPNDGTTTDVTVIGYAYSFNGSSSMVAVPSADNLNPQSSPITLTVHVNLTILPPSRHDYDLIRKGLGSTTGGEYKVEIVSSGRVLCLFRGTNGIMKRKAGLNQPLVSDGQWHTIQCENTGTTTIVHVDNLTWGKSGSPGAISNTADLVVGAKAVSTRANNDWYNGEMDEVSVSIG